MTTTRTGASVRRTVMDCPAALAETLGLTPEQARRIIRIRRVLPFSQDRSTPAIDARKLWERIGKPQGKFADWVKREIKPLAARTGNISQIREISTPTARRPRIDYHLSRDMAAFLAMMADTAQGDEIRAYFLDMEELSIKLAEHIPLRVAVIVDSDNAATHFLRKRAGDKVKTGKATRGEAFAKASEQEKHLKSMVCEVLSGIPAGVWREATGKGVRDTLDTEDLTTYGRAYSNAVFLLQGGTGRAKVREMLSACYANKINPEKYGLTGENTVH